MAVRHGASAIGLVSEMPSGPGVIPDKVIREIAAEIPPAIGTFLLTSLPDAGAIIEQQRRCRTNTIQLCDRLDPAGHQALRQALPGISLAQVIQVSGPEAVGEARTLASGVDALLLDSGNRSLPVPELGGTGRVHDWEISRRICQQVDVPLFLAGGLTAHNVREAIEKVRPFGVDVCTGVRTEGQLDEVKLTDFLAQVHRTEKN